MPTDYAQLRTTNPAEYQRLIQQQGQQLAAGLNLPKPTPNMGMPQQSAVPAPAPTNMGGFKSTMPGLPTAPSSPVPAPQIGNGGGNYNNLDYAGKLQMQNDASRIQSDPTFRQSEIDRTLGVIKDRTGANQDIGAQNDYLTRVLGYQPPQAPKPPQQVQSAVPAPVDNRAYNVGTDADRDAESRRRVEQAIADKRRIATQQKTGLATSFGRMRQEVGEDRVLQNLQNDRRLSAANGRSEYERAMIAREREKTDRQQSEDFATRSANVDEMLAGYENASAEERQRIVDELTRADRDFGINQGQLTGTYGNQRTLAGSAQDFNQGMANKEFDYKTNPNNPSNVGQNLQNELAKLKLDNYPQEVRQAAQLFEQQLQSGTISNETAQWKLKELQDPNSPTNQAAKMDLQLKQMEVDYMPQEQRLKLQQLQKQIAEIGKAPYKSQQDVEYDKVKLQTAQEQLKQLQNPKPEKVDISGYTDRFDKLYVSKDPYTNESKVTNPSALRSAIIALNLPDSETDKLLLSYGLPVN